MAIQISWIWTSFGLTSHVLRGKIEKEDSVYMHTNEH